VRIKVFSTIFTKKYLPVIHSTHTTVYCSAPFRKKEIHTFIQQGCIKMSKSVRKDIYNVTKCF